ncbi:MAG TPA: SRPBCC family protein [Solirubrobacteraceae bacterium]|nr:SRPBCC family protein [Solirubrobacteraceae bacterium]
MKELTGNASATTTASPAESLALLEAIDAYPRWAGDLVREAEVLERDGAGHPFRARAKLHVERGPLTRDFDLLFAVKVDAGGTVALTRIPHQSSDRERFDVTWSVDGAQSTRIELRLAANLDVPRFVPLGGVGDSMAADLVNAATRALASP